MRIAFGFVIAVFVAACSGSQAPTSAPAGSAAPTVQGGAGGGGASGGAGGGASVAAAAAQVKDWCALIPADIIATFAPSAPPVSAGTYPGECGASNGVSALDFQYTTGFNGSLPAGAENVPNVGQYAYLDRPSKDEVELWVALSSDSDRGLFIDLAGHDGKDHTAEAVAIANAILAKLH
jgi:hypothetical protein